ncbi:hypothetical protein ZL58_14155 [Salmonella enterica subsp. enterica serovar Typhimurium]|nr:hypothetical protein [Salmonella enterica subsp. enterica serovar Typhimurium]
MDYAAKKPVADVVAAVEAAQQQAKILKTRAAVNAGNLPVTATLTDPNNGASMTVEGIDKGEYDLAKNAEDIASNHIDISAVRDRVSTMEHDDVRIQQDIAKNEKDIADHKTAQDSVNHALLSTNLRQDTLIQDNTAGISSLTQRTNQIGTKAFDNGEAIAAIKPVVAQHTQAIADQKDFININAQNIKAVGGIVADNKADQDKVNHALVNTNIHQDTLIKSNATNISGLQTESTAAATQAKLTQKQVDNNTQRSQENRTAVVNLGEQTHLMSAQIEHNRATGAYAQSRADAAYANTEANHEALVNTNKRVSQNSADIANHEQRIQTLESNTNAKFGQLKSEVDQNRKRASAGIAGVAAMANIPQVIQGQTFSVGAGVGNTDGESALAVGMSARASENVVVKASVSNDTQHNFVVGAGVSYGW